MNEANVTVAVEPTAVAAEETGRRIVRIERAVLGKNQAIADRLREHFRSLGIRVVNVLSSPGSGKTELLKRSLTDLRDRVKAAVIVGDLATANDAIRLQATGAPTVQINTGTVCHLDASMIERAVEQIDLTDLRLLFLENVGNLVCPASYDLGEDTRVVLLSVTEGEDKPLKYPVIFGKADVVVISKIDVAEVLGFDRESAYRNIQQVAPAARIVEVSAKSGMGLAGWYELLYEPVPGVS